MAAAVADFTPANPSDKKIKKEQGFEQIRLNPTKDILQKLGKEKKSNQVLVGFALETDNEEVNARMKLENKNLDLIVLNSLKDDGAGFGHATNKITILTKDGKKTGYQLKSKKEVAADILVAVKNYM